MLARDERGGLAAVDVRNRDGKTYPLNERTLPGSYGETHDKLGRIDREGLPTVERVRQGRERVHEQRAGPGLAAGAADLGKGVAKELNEGKKALGRDIIEHVMGGEGGPSRDRRPEQPAPGKDPRGPDHDQHRGPGPRRGRGFGR